MTAGPSGLSTPPPTMMLNLYSDETIVFNTDCVQTIGGRSYT